MLPASLLTQILYLIYSIDQAVVEGHSVTQNVKFLAMSLVEVLYRILQDFLGSYRIL